MNRRELLVALVSSVAASCGPKLPTLRESSPRPGEESGFPHGYIWRFNAGPHDDPDIPIDKQVLYAIDIGIPEIVNPGQETKSGIKYPFAAVRGGKVYSLNRDSGTIHIKDENGQIINNKILAPIE